MLSSPNPTCHISLSGCPSLLSTMLLKSLKPEEKTIYYTIYYTLLPSITPYNNPIVLGLLLLDNPSFTQ